MDLIEIENLREIIIDCIEVGYMKAIKDYCVDEDLIRATQIDSWLAKNNISKKTFKTLLNEHSIVGIRKGTARNSPIYYSKEQVKAALLVEKNVNKYINAKTS